MRRIRLDNILGESHPDTVVLYDPGEANLNRGDEVISDSAQRYIAPICEGKYVIRLSSHQSASFRYQRNYSHNGLGFVLGSNLLKGRMLFGYRQWNISLIDSLQIRNLVLVGCGWQVYESRTTDYYSRLLYSRLLSKEYMHSVRDEYTKKKLEDIGIKNVINTGCPTLWSLDRDHCSSIRKNKGEIVVTTVTDYNKNPEMDHLMLETLAKNYSKVYLWTQGSSDLDYYESICSHCESFEIINPTLREYDSFLSDHPEADYVGTRLHGGIRALQHGNRTLIVAIDNRAREMGRDFNLPIFERDNISKVQDCLNSEIVCNIRIDERAIGQFLQQFSSFQ